VRERDGERESGKKREVNILKSSLLQVDREAL
jgi:hypothetical protein